jgi:hypothetical protein
MPPRERLVSDRELIHAIVNNAGSLRDRMLTSMIEDDFELSHQRALQGTSL